MSPQGVYPAADVCAIGDEISSTYEGRHITLYAENLEHGSAVDYVTKGYPVWQNNLVGVAFNTQAAGTNPLIAVDTEGIWCQDVKGENDAGDIAIAPGDALYINTTTGLISGITDESTQLPFGYALGNVGSGSTERIAVKVHWNPLTSQIVNLGTDKFNIASWGVTLDEGYHMYFNDDYSCYIGSSANNVLMIGTALGIIEFRCGPAGASFWVRDSEFGSNRTGTFTGIIDLIGGHLHLPRKTSPVTMPTEGQIWYNTSISKLQFCTATGVSLETVTSA